MEPIHADILETVGYVLVPVSLLCLALTIIIYISLKYDKLPFLKLLHPPPTRSLWSMRNYIHIMLCANLFLAQLLFVTGISRTSNPVRHPHTHTCSCTHFSTASVFGHCCGAAVLVPGDLHVDADGRCGLVYSLG